jgi:hypothetical protein
MRKRHAPKIRWIRALEAYRAVSIRQPWAWLIVNGYKDIENRSWRTRYRGRILIHAGVSTRELKEHVLEGIRRRYGIRLPSEYDRGGIVGVVDIVDCLKRTRSPWHIRGQMGWRLERPRRLKFRECVGALSLFKPRFKNRRGLARGNRMKH